MSQILCRLDSNANAAVVFNVDNWNKDDSTILVWTNGATELKPVPMTYYYGTSALSANDERIMAERYAAAMNDANVQIRHRLPRTEKQRPDLLKRASATENSVVLPNVHQEAANAPSVVPMATGMANPVITTLTPQKPAKAAKRGRPAGGGKGRAKPIEAQKLPVAGPDVALHAISALEAQIAAIKQAMGIPA